MFFYLGSAPIEENCVQVNSENDTEYANFLEM